MVTAVALLYSAAHFARSGILQPLDHPNLGKFYEQVWPLRPHLETGAPVHTTNPAQYGPVFFFVMHPLLRANPDDQTLANWLYAMQLVLIVGSFLLTCAALKLSLPVPDHYGWPLLVAWLAVLWLNFSPLYTILALKSVETWELQLISLGLYAHLRGWRWTAAFAIASAALIKVLPAVFIYYWLITDRRTFSVRVRHARRASARRAICSTARKWDCGTYLASSPGPPAIRTDSTGMRTSR